MHEGISAQLRARVLAVCGYVTRFTRVPADAGPRPGVVSHPLRRVHRLRLFIKTI